MSPRYWSDAVSHRKSGFGTAKGYKLRNKVRYINENTWNVELAFLMGLSKKNAEKFSWWTKDFRLFCIFVCKACLSLFHNETLWSLKYIVYKCHICFRQRSGQFFHRHTCIQWLHSFSLYNASVYTCHTFLYFIRIFLSHILSCAQHVSVCFTLKLCFCLLNTLSTMSQLFQTEKGPIFELSHLYTVVT